MLGKQYLAKNTNSTYFWGQVSFLEFAIAYKKWPPMPVADRTLGQWVYWAASVKDLSVKTIKTYVFGIRAMHLENGQVWTCWTQRFPVYQALRSVKKIFGEERRTLKLHITLRILAGLVKWANGWNSIDSAAKMFRCKENAATFKAQCLVAFYGMLRKDNIAVAKADAFNPNRHLCRMDFGFEDQPGLRPALPELLRIKIRHSKVIQFDNRCHEVLYVATGTALCPVNAVRECLDLTLQDDEMGPAFVWKSGRKWQPATHRQFVRSVKAGVQHLGLDPAAYAGISFRRGGATLAAEQGVDKELIKELGDWKSDAYELYCRRPLSQRLILPTLFAKLARV